MQLGIIGTYGAFNPADFDAAKARGLSFVEYCINIGCDWQAFAASADEINAAIARTGITVGSIGRWGTARITADGPIAEEMEADKALIRTAAKVGCPVFVCGCNRVEDLSEFENCQLAIHYFQELLDLGKEVGVKIALYNCRWNNFVCCDPYWTLILGRLPDLGIKYDASHCINESDNDYLTEMRDWGRRFYHVHIKGTLKIGGQHVDDPPAGLDMINWNALMGMLYAVGYDGNLSIEPHSAVWQGELGEKGVDYTIRYIRERML